ncbi:MAG: ABC transporter permease [Terriglobales bacterium]
MFGWRRKERELQEEIEFHLAQAERKYDSRAKAAALLGGEDAAKEACRDERRGAWLSSVGRDLRLGARILRKSSGFTAAAVITLALCIGVVTTMSSVLDAALATPPFPHPDRIVRPVPSVSGYGPVPQSVFQAADYADLRAGAPAFAQLAAYNFKSFNLAGDGKAVHATGMEVTPNFFRVLGSAPARGRLFAATERNAVVLSYGLWRKQFGGKPVLGKTIKLDSVPHSITGVMPRGFAETQFGIPSQFAVQVWVPLVIPPEGLRHTLKTTSWVYAIGRLRPGATLAETQQQVAAIARRNAARYPDAHIQRETALTLRQSVAQTNMNLPALVTFMVLAVLILLIGCANVAGLGLGRAMARGDEMAIRRALGAGCGRLVRQVLTENCLLAGIAGALGLFAGWAGIAALNAGFAGTISWPMDGTVLGVTVLATGLVALASGLPPALRVSTRPQARGVIGERSRVRNVLVAVEVCLTLAGLIVIAALVQGVWRELHTPLGFQDTGVTAAQLDLRGPNYTNAEEQARLAGQLQTAAAALPGVQAAALISPPPLEWNERKVAVRGRAAYDWHRLPTPAIFYASSGYLQTLRIPLLTGRAFNTTDVAAAPPVALISRSVARRLFPDGTSPIGQYVRVGATPGPWREIVGETGNVARYPGDTSTNGEIFIPLQQVEGPAALSLGILLRTSGSPDALIAPLRQALAKIDPTLALFGAGTLADVLARQGDSTDAIFAHLLELMAVLALLLSAIGLYCIVAFAAAARRREIGIRSALGATVPQLRRLLLRGGFRVMLSGIVAGTGLGWAGLRWFMSAESAQGVTLQTTIAIPVVLIAMVAAVAVYLPARRAARADPLAALRVE